MLKHTDTSRKKAPSGAVPFKSWQLGLRQVLSVFFLDFISTADFQTRLRQKVSNEQALPAKKAPSGTFHSKTYGYFWQKRLLTSWPTMLSVIFWHFFLAKRLLWAPFHSIKVATAWAKAVMQERELADQPCFLWFLDIFPAKKAPSCAITFNTIYILPTKRIA